MSETHNHFHHDHKGTPEEVAYKLMKDVFVVEGKLKYQSHDLSKESGIDRQTLLDTYAECLQAVKLPGQRVGKESGPRIRSLQP